MANNTYFRSNGYLADDLIQSSDGGQFLITDLPGFLRTLLVADGTVTKTLEAWFWEPVSVTPLRQAIKILVADLPELEAEAGDEVLEREVCLTGGESQQHYACARSVLAINQLSVEMRTALLEGRMGIGELLREQGVETYREIVALDYIRKGSTQDEILNTFSDDLVSRSYRIRVGGVPAILVTEYFPVGTYR